jgi:hypothetical protein
MNLSKRKSRIKVSKKRLTKKRLTTKRGGSTVLAAASGVGHSKVDTPSTLDIDEQNEQVWAKNQLLDTMNNNLEYYKGFVNKRMGRSNTLSENAQVLLQNHNYDADATLEAIYQVKIKEADKKNPLPPTPTYTEKREKRKAAARQRKADVQQRKADAQQREADEKAEAEAEAKAQSGKRTAARQREVARENYDTEDSDALARALETIKLQRQQKLFRDVKTQIVSPMGATFTDWSNFMLDLKTYTDDLYAKEYKSNGDITQEVVDNIKVKVVGMFNEEEEEEIGVEETSPIMGQGSPVKQDKTLKERIKEFFDHLRGIDRRAAGQGDNPDSLVVAVLTKRIAPDIQAELASGIVKIHMPGSEGYANRMVPQVTDELQATMNNINAALFAYGDLVLHASTGLKSKSNRKKVVLTFNEDEEVKNFLKTVMDKYPVTGSDKKWTSMDKAVWQKAIKLYKELLFSNAHEIPDI